MVGVNAGHIGPRNACRLREAARARSLARISIIKKEHYLSSTYRRMLCNSFFKNSVINFFTASTWAYFDEVIGL